jgi:hypothetical protein
MLETVTTNGASILVMITLWATAAWALTYVYMAEKAAKLRETIQFLDIYIDEFHRKNEFDYYSDGEWMRG